MPGLFPNPLYLTKTKRSELEELVKKHSTPQQIVLRARIIMLADEGKNHRQIARELKISRDTARHWRRRWLDMAGDSFSTLGPIYITSPACCGDILKHIANRLHTRASVLHFQ
jgi:putative transposase